MREGSGSECGYRCPLREGSGQPAGHRQGVLPCHRLSLRLPDGPRNVEQQVDTPDHSHAPPLDNRDGPCHSRLHLGKTCPVASRGAQGPRATLCPVSSSTGQRSREGAGPSHIPPQKRALRAGGTELDLSVPRPGPLGRQYRHFLRTRPVAFSTEGFSLCGKGQR